MIEDEYDSQYEDFEDDDQDERNKYTHVGNESAILKIRYYNPPDLIFSHLPVLEKVKNIEVKRMRNGYTIDTLTSVDFQEIVKIGRKVIQIYEAVIYRENF